MEDGVGGGFREASRGSTWQVDGGRGAPLPSSGDIVLLQEVPPRPPPAALFVRAFKTVLPGVGEGGRREIQ